MHCNHIFNLLGLEVNNSTDPQTPVVMFSIGDSVELQCTIYAHIDGKWKATPFTKTFYLTEGDLLVFLYNHDERPQSISFSHPDYPAGALFKLMHGVKRFKGVIRVEIVLRRSVCPVKIQSDIRRIVLEEKESPRDQTFKVNGTICSEYGESTSQEYGSMWDAIEDPNAGGKVNRQSRLCPVQLQSGLKTKKMGEWSKYLKQDCIILPHCEIFICLTQ